MKWLAMLLLSGCTSPLWWSTEMRSFEYRNWHFEIRNQADVIKRCPISMMGCTYPGYGLAFAVDNAWAVSHECNHINNFTDKLMAIADEVGHESPEAQARAQQVFEAEMTSDILAEAMGLHSLAALATIAVPGIDCGSDTNLRPYMTRELLEKHRQDFYKWLETR